MENRIKYSQNFLRDKELVKKILNKSDIGPADLVLEIGAGKGIITEELAKRCKKVIAIEKDKKLYQFLEKKFSGKEKVKVVLADFLKYNLPNKKYKVFANIPFNITAEVIKKIVGWGSFLQTAYLIIQKEAAEKFVGFPYSKKNQLYALLIKPWFSIKVIYSFKRTDFKPSPRINSVLVKIVRLQKPLIKRGQEKLYQDFLAYSFTRWKPTLKNTLKKIFTYRQLKQLSRNLNFDIKAKPTDINFKQWMGLFNYFLTGVDKNKQILVRGAKENLVTRQKRLQKIHRTSAHIKKSHKANSLQPFRHQISEISLQDKPANRKE